MATRFRILIRDGTKFYYHESDQLNTVLAFYEQEIEQHTGCCIELVLFSKNRYFWRKRDRVRVKRFSLEEFCKKCHDVVMWVFFLMSS